MLKVTLLYSAQEFAGEFERCCHKYTSLDIATAWCGRPQLVLPYSHIETFTGPVRAIVGQSFNHSHPEGIEFLRAHCADLRVFRDGGELFHPKLYIFSDGLKRAIFVGSSNFTYQGFYCNKEANVLLEGTPSHEEEAQIKILEGQLSAWRSDQFSFVPSDAWIRTYRKDYARTVRREKQYNIPTARQHESAMSEASWLRNASWEIYWRRLNEGLQQHNRTLDEYHSTLTVAAEKLPLPWRKDYFDELERRKIIWGMEPYGWLGHVAAAGRFKKLLAKGTERQKNAIVEAINAIGALTSPIEWPQFQTHLQELCDLGLSMKVWGRLLCLVRPDLYCTVASDSVRKNLSAVLGIPQARFQTPAGYIQVLKLVHASPWFQAPLPVDTEQARVWKRRAAFMDGIFYYE